MNTARVPTTPRSVTAHRAVTIEYAIRYCLTRQSYAFDDGLELAEQHWHELSAATHRDVLAAVAARGMQLSSLRFPRLVLAQQPLVEVDQ